MMAGRKNFGGHISMDYMNFKECIGDIATIGLMAFLGGQAIGPINSTAAASGIYASVHDVIRDQSHNAKAASYSTRSIARSIIPGISAIGLRMASSPTQNSSEYLADVGLTMGLYLGGLLFSPTIRKGPRLIKKGISLISRLQIEDSKDETFKIEDQE